MGTVESQMLDYIKKRHVEGALSVTKEEIVNAVVQNDPRFRNSSALFYGLRRLRLRYLVNAVDAPDGTTHYFIGSYPSADLRKSLGL